VHQLREGIDRGAYEVDPGRVAEAMLGRIRGAA
jgi:anti-sigma28 factor (negative regulator of flagellin synthesis)